MGKKEIIFGLVLVVVSVSMFVLTYQFPRQTLALSPRVFPRFVSLCMFILAVILIIQGTEACGSQGRAAYADFSYAKSSYDSFRFNDRSGVRLYQNSAAFRLYACPPFVAGTMIVFHEKRWSWIVGVSLLDNRIVLAFSYAL